MIKNNPLHFLFYIAVCAAIFTGCAKDESSNSSIGLSTKTLQFTKIGGSQWIEVTANGDWGIENIPDWCSVEPSHGSGSQRIQITVGQNSQITPRYFTLVFSIGSSSRSSLEIEQETADKAIIPLIFHLLNSNIRQERIKEAVDSLNKFYNKTSGNPISIDFQLAERSPSGEVLEEPGIERIAMDVTGMSPRDFLAIKPSERKEFAPLFWDPNKYINIWVYDYPDKKMLGISHLSYTLNQSLEGLEDGSYYLSQLPDYMHGMSFCSDTFIDKYFYERRDVVTIYHEVGHYLGLLHAFDETGEGKANPDDAADDYCSDTPQYDRPAYDEWYSTLIGSPEEIYYRTSYLGQRFLATNVMDYDPLKTYELTAQQRDRILNVLKNSPLIPGRTRILGKSISGNDYPIPTPIIME